MIKQGFHFIVLLASIYLIFAITDDRILAVFNKCKESDSTQKYPALDEIFEPDWNTTDPDIKCFVMCLGVELGEVDPKTGGAILEGILKNDYEEVEKVSNRYNFESFF